MDKYERISALLEQMENLLDGFILSGTGVIREGTENELKKLQDQCRKTGLHFCGELLEELEKSLSEKRHSLNADDSKVMESCCQLGAYLSAVRVKLRFNAAEERIKTTAD